MLDDREEYLSVINDEGRGWCVPEKRAKVLSEILRMIPPVRQIVRTGPDAMGLELCDKDLFENSGRRLPPVFPCQHDDAVVTETDQPVH